MADTDIGVDGESAGPNQITVYLGIVAGEMDFRTFKPSPWSQRPLRCKTMSRARYGAPKVMLPHGGRTGDRDILHRVLASRLP